MRAALRSVCGEDFVKRRAYNFLIMDHINIEHSSISEVCDGVKKLGYAAFEHVRLYGEEFQLVSDPFPDADGIAVRAKTVKDSSPRIVQIPATVIQTVRSRKAA